MKYFLIYSEFTTELLETGGNVLFSPLFTMITFKGSQKKLRVSSLSKQIIEINSKITAMVPVE